MRREIAALPEIEDEMIKEMLEMDEEPLQRTLDIMGRKLQMRGFGPSVIVAYQAMGPLLRENRPVLAYRARTGSSEVAGALPDVGTLDEAMTLATMEWRLDTEERGQLRRLLAPLVPPKA